MKFLEEQLSYTPVTFSQTNISDIKLDKRNKAPVHQVAPQRESKGSCTLCSRERHPLYLCPTYKAMNHDKKNSYIKNNHLCSNCLSAGHKTQDCRSPGRCQKCGKSHHTSLHQESTSTNLVETPAFHSTSEHTRVLHLPILILLENLQLLLQPHLHKVKILFP